MSAERDSDEEVQVAVDLDGDAVETERARFFDDADDGDTADVSAPATSRPETTSPRRDRPRGIGADRP